MVDMLFPVNANTMIMKRITYIFFLIFILKNITLAQNNPNHFNWPGNKKAAVCLTFDDGLDCHLDKAIPLLDSFNMKGTFYCTGNSLSLQNRITEWGAIAEAGHELGNHALFHPCDGNKFDWVKPEYDLQNYTIEQIRAELFVANTLLKAIDGRGQRTFAYNCSDYMVKDSTSFVDVVRELFPAARRDGPVPRQMTEVDLHFMPSWCVIDNTGAELIDYVEEARKNGTIATFMFHSVGGGYLNVSLEALKELLTYLNNNEEDYWVDTFFNVTEYISLKIF